MGSESMVAGVLALGVMSYDQHTVSEPIRTSAHQAEVHNQY